MPTKTADQMRQEIDSEIERLLARVSELSIASTALAPRDTPKRPRRMDGTASPKGRLASGEPVR